MSEHERTGIRDLAYSRWHRVASFSRYMPVEHARLCTMIDMDANEYCSSCGRALAFCETAFDTGNHKATWVLRCAALQAQTTGWLVYYRKDERDDMAGFRIRQIAPEYGPELEWTPEQWARQVYRLRERHRPYCTGPLKGAVQQEMQRRLL